MAKDIVERLNAYTHFFGAAFAAVGCIYLPWHALRHNSDTHVVLGIAAFCICLLGMLCSSAFYHQLHHTNHAAKLQRLDHCAIFLLIAGSYTPFMIVARIGDVLAGVWTLAIVGIVRSIIGAGTRSERSILALVTGWLGAWCWSSMKERVGEDVMSTVVGGGVAYSVGIPFYLGGKRIPILHVVWHVAVMVGGGLHFWALWKMVAAEQ